MQINDQGFTERLSSGSTASRVASTSDATNGTTGASKQQGSSSDLLQLSSFAARLQSAGTGDAASSSRSSRLSQIAQLVNSGSFQIDPAKISSALVSEAVQSAAAR